ncbi:MAG: hypothetical protein IJ943_07455 [Akkermansia sp.]|nr:hypothetical protein [Akkermansia sp.]
MFIATIAGYLVATLFAFCGLVSIGHVLSDLSTIKSAAEFVNTLAVAAWPLAVAVVVYLLTQVASLLQRQGIMLSCVQPPLPAPVTKVKKPVPVRPAQPMAADYFQTAPAPEEPVALPPRVPQPPTEEAPTPAAPARKNEVKETPNGLNFFRVD